MEFYLGPIFFAHTTSRIFMHQVIFDPNVVSAATLMDFFFVIHDPTTLNRQGTHSFCFAACDLI